MFWLLLCALWLVAQSLSTSSGLANTGLVTADIKGPRGNNGRQLSIPAFGDGDFGFISVTFLINPQLKL
jgi:hypothetical protein